MYKLDTRVHHKSFNQINEIIEKVCLENNCHYIDNRNVNESDSFKDGLHLPNFDKRNFVS